MKKLILKWLGVDKLAKENYRLNKEIEKLKLSYRLKEHDLDCQIDRVDKIIDQFDIAVDVNFHRDPCWAVVCIQGKPEYVRFAHLKEAEARHIRDLLNSFSPRRVIIDAPIGFGKSIGYGNK